MVVDMMVVAPIMSRLGTVLPMSASDQSRFRDPELLPHASSLKTRRTKGKQSGMFATMTAVVTSPTYQLRKIKLNFCVKL